MQELNIILQWDPTIADNLRTNSVEYWSVLISGVKQYTSLYKATVLLLHMAGPSVLMKYAKFLQ